MGEFDQRFPASYAESRTRLLALAHRLAPRLGLLIDSRSLDARGPHEETLALDFMILGARRPRHALVLSCGTHGVEGYCGAALQHWLLDALLPQVRLDADTAVIVQHANNPYGFAWNRRVNENNVDLNRNFRDHFDPTDCDPDYEALADCFNPPDLEPSNELARQARVDAFIASAGLRRYQSAASAGQCKYPRGMQFAGQALQPGARHLLALAGEHLASVRTLLWIDVHTGLGERGRCELITGALPDSAGYRLARRVFGEKLRSASAGESVSPPLAGLLDGGLARVLPAEANAGFVFPEFGTHPLHRVLSAIRADNWLHAHGDRDSAQGRAITAELLEALRPHDRDWERQVLATGAAYVEQALAALPGAHLPYAARCTPDAPGPGDGLGPVSDHAA